MTQTNLRRKILPPKASLLGEDSQSEDPIIIEMVVVAPLADDVTAESTSTTGSQRLLQNMTFFIGQISETFKPKSALFRVASVLNASCTRCVISDQLLIRMLLITMYPHIICRSNRMASLLIAAPI